MQKWRSAIHTSTPRCERSRVKRFSLANKWLPSRMRGCQPGRLGWPTAAAITGSPNTTYAKKPCMLSTSAPSTPLDAHQRRVASKLIHWYLNPDQTTTETSMQIALSQLTQGLLQVVFVIRPR